MHTCTTYHLNYGLIPYICFVNAAAAAAAAVIVGVVLTRLFSPFVRAWLMETVDKFDDILKNALRKDQAEKVGKPKTTLSSSNYLCKIF